MIEIIEVIREDFDGSENNSSDAKISKSLGLFVGNGSLSAHGVAAAYISKLEATKHYLGWNGQVYPQFKVTTRYATGEGVI